MRKKLAKRLNKKDENIGMDEKMHEQILKIGIKMRSVFEEMKEANITDFDYFRDALTEDWKEIDRGLNLLDKIINEVQNWKHKSSGLKHLYKRHIEPYLKETK